MNAFSNPPPEFENDIVTLDMCTPRKIPLQGDADKALDDAFRTAASYIVEGILGGVLLLGAWAALVNHFG